MVDEKTKTIGISGLVALGIVLISSLVPGFFDDPKYYCAAESSIMECPGELSGGSATRCYLNKEKSSWDYCKSGWLEITDDRPIQEQPGDVPDSAIGEKAWLCSIEGCVAI